MQQRLARRNVSDDAKTGGGMADYQHIEGLGEVACRFFRTLIRRQLQFGRLGEKRFRARQIAKV